MICSCFVQQDKKRSAAAAFAERKDLDEVIFIIVV